MGFLRSLENTQDLISLPVVATRILAMLENDNVHLRELSALIESDASISLKVIRLANSPVFAMRSEVTNIPQAVATVGMNRIMNIVLGVSIFSKFVFLSDSSVGPFVERFWEHSACTAGISKFLAMSFKKNFHDTEFVGGLIHDVGKLCMIQYDSKKYEKVLNLVEHDNYSDMDAELRVYGATHTQVGEILARQWKLPSALRSIVSYHQTPELAGTDSGVTSIVRLADIVCEKSGRGVGEQIPDENLSESNSWRNLCSLYPELQSVDIDALCSELDEEYTKASSLLMGMLS